MSHIFTPFWNPDIPDLKKTEDSDEEYSFVEMQLSDEDSAKIGRGPGWSADVSDLITGRRFKVAAAPCNISTCFCAAKIVEEIT